MRLTLPSVAFIASACSGAPAVPASFFDQCERSEPAVLASSDWEIDDVLLLGDERGWVVFWVSQECLCAPDRQGLFAARPGEPAVRLSDVPSAAVRGVVVEDGYLVCWGGLCATVDPGLRLLDEPFGQLDAYYARIGDQLYGLQYRSEAHWLATVGERGVGWGPSVPLPCAPYAWSEDRLACVTSSGSTCRFEYNALAGDCMIRFRLADLDGAYASEEVEVASTPDMFAGFGSSVAAGPDGFAIAWSDRTGLHAQTFDDDGTPVGSLDSDVQVGLPEAYPAPGGFLVTWASYDDDRRGSRVAALRFDATGALLSGPDLVGEDQGPAHQGFHRSAAAVGDGWAMAWLGEDGVNQDLVSTVHFQSFGCD